MTLLEGFICNNIYVDGSADPYYSSDQVNITHPVRFATVSLQLLDTQGLSWIADEVRMKHGFPPMEPADDYTEETCDQNGWYNFYIGLNAYSKTKVDSCIEFTVASLDYADNGELYKIDLTEEEQVVLFARLNEQCKMLYDMNCGELLEKAKKELEEEYVF